MVAAACMGLLFVASASVTVAFAPDVPSLAFHYGAEPPTELLAFFSRVVLDPARAKPAIARALASRGVTVLARLPCPRSPTTSAGAAGLAESSRSVRASIDRARGLAEQGYAGFVVEPGGTWTAPELGALVHGLRTEWPEAPILLEQPPDAVLPDSAGQGAVANLRGELSGLVSGPLFSTWSSAAHHYEPVPQPVRDVRVAALQRLARASGLPIIDVEATAPALSRAAARALAGQVAALGFVPWIAPVDRDQLGVGVIESVPRRVLVVVDGVEEPFLPDSVAHRLVALPLEYLGFAVDYVDVRSGALPSPASTGERYAGIVTWFTDDELPGSGTYERWLLSQMDAGVRVAMLGHVGFAPSEAFLRRLGVRVGTGETTDPAVRPPVRIVAADRWMGFEAAPVARARDLVPYVVPATFTRHLQLEDANGHIFSPVFEADWGGMALDPYVTEIGFEARQRWIVDPFHFLASALALPDIPVPDPTTENGRRVLEIHVDGDGFVSLAELPGHPVAGEVIRRDFLAPYRLPTTVSIIEGEIGAAGLYPARTRSLEPVARAIFALPEVEIASHTYSHPFDWLRAQAATWRPGEGGGNEPSELTGVEGDRLNIPGYRYSLAREIDGSVGYIDDRLAPAGKGTRVFLWSGNALPPEEAIARTDGLGLENLNGDNAEEPGPTLTLAGVPSFVRPVGDHLQIYAPAQNENVYTNLWHGPFYGFRRVIDYFRFTDLPRRLKPIGIYYHFFSGTKAASVKALHDVYDWAATQESFPMWVSEYAARVRGFERATLARRLDGTWLLRGLGELHTVRLSAALGWPDLVRSPEVVGVRDLPQGRYVSFAPTSTSTPASTAPVSSSGPGSTRILALSDAAPSVPYVEATNAEVVSWRRAEGQLWFHLHGHVPVELTLGGCAANQRLDASTIGGGTGRRLHFTAVESGEVHAFCR